MEERYAMARKSSFLWVVLTTATELLITLFLWIYIIHYCADPALVSTCLVLVGLRWIEQVICKVFLKMDRLNNDDVFWLLQSYKDDNIINGVMLLNEYFEVDRFQKIIKTKLVEAKDDKGRMRYPNASKYIKSGLLNYYWCEENAFDIEKHVYAYKTKVYSSKKEMMDQMSKVSARTLGTNTQTSPWEFVFLYFKEKNVIKTCIVVRFHHALADGMSFLNFILNYMGDDVQPQVSPRTVPIRLQIMLKVKGLFYMPWNLTKGCLNIMFRNKKTALWCENVTGKTQFSWSTPINLKTIKEIKNKLKVSVNDVLIGCIATSIRRYLKENKEDIPDKVFTAFPFTTRYSLKEAESFGNKVGPVFLPMPLNCNETWRNISTINNWMSEEKRSGRYHGMRYSTISTNYLFPYTWNKFLFASFCSKMQMVLSSLPGPQLPITVDGVTVQTTCFWPPQHCNGIAMSVFSYRDEVRIALSCDAGLKLNANSLFKHIPNIVKTLADSLGVDDFHGSD